MRKFALALVAMTVIATPALAQDFHANRVACVKEAGGSPTYRHGHYGWRLHHLGLSQAYMDCVGRRAAVTRASSTGKVARIYR
jgi:hypothetical protein